MNDKRFNHKVLFYFVSVLLLAVNSFAYSIAVEDTVSNYIIKIANDKNERLFLVQDLKGKKIYSKQFINPATYFYDLDGDDFDEAVIVDSIPDLASFNYSLYVYSFEPKFELCDSLSIGRSLPEFYDFDSDVGYFIKVYDNRFENIFGSSLKILPIQFYNLIDKTLLLDNDFSYEEYESELDNLLNLLDEAKRGFDCNNLEAKKDIQKIIAVIYADLMYMNSQLSMDNFVKQNYLCSDVASFLQVLKQFFE